MSRTISLGVLENLRIAAPCSVRWDDMKGDAQVRHCDRCNLNVFNLSEMTRAEAEALVLKTQGRLCAGFWQRADGTVITRNCPVGLAAVRARAARVVTRVAAAVGFLVSGAVLLGARTRSEEARLRVMQPFATIVEWLNPAPVQVGQRFMMGEVCAPAPRAPVPGAPAATPQ